MCELANQPAFRAALIRTAADQYRFVLTNHHIVLDGWSLPILLGEVFASYYGQRLPPLRPIGDLSPGWPAVTSMLLARRGVRCWPASMTPTLVGPAGRVGAGRREVASFQVSEEPRGPSVSWRGRVIPQSARCFRVPMRRC